jgi:tyrosyl-tRNA synthetase
MDHPVDLLADLDARGLVHDTTDRAALAARLASGPVSVYVGFDPTADSLHVGHLLGQMMLRRFQVAGHKPFPLAGGATGMVGDPSGRSEERTLLDRDTLRGNVEKIKLQLARLLDFEPGPYQATMVNNADWTEPIGVLDFLRDVGKHFTVNQMVARDSVRNRMQGEHGISFTEFSYMLLQAFDFRVLYETYGVEMQMGGSDQWGNIVGGVDLIRRAHGVAAHALTHPLVTKSDGSKFGKSAGGSVWLDPHKTSPYQFRQFWMQADDQEVERFLLWLTLLPTAEVHALMEAHRAEPGKRLAQSRLAAVMTALVHGEAASRAAEDAAGVLFGGDPADASAEVLATIAAEVGCTPITVEELLAVPALLVRTGLCASLSDARRTLEQRGITVNGHTVDAGSAIERAALLHGRYAVLRRGRKSYHLVEVSPPS